MRIFYVTQNYPPEIIGGSTRAEDFVRNLVVEHKVSVICPFPTVPFLNFKRKFSLTSSEKKSKNLDIIRIYTYQPNKRNPSFIQWILYYLVFSLLSSLWIMLHINSTDLIITTSPPIFTYLPGLVSNIIFGKKIIIDIRDLWLSNVTSLGLVSKSSIEFCVSKKLENLAILRAAKIFTMTETIKKDIMKNYRVPEEKFVIIPHCIDVDLFKPNQSSKKSNIIYTGKIRLGGGLDKFVHAMKCLKSHNIKLVIYGDGELRDNLETEIKKYNLTNNVEIRPIVPRNQIPKLISECALGIVPLQENMGLGYATPTKLLEFMACGIPVIATNVGGETSRIFEISKCGILTQNKPKEIARAIEHLFDNPTIMKEMGLNGRKFIQEYCDRNKIIKKVDQALN